MGKGERKMAKIFKPTIPKMPSGLREQKRLGNKRKRDRSGTASRSRYITDKK